jgi:predicted oxidoreductase
MEKVLASGKVKAIGVSNFSVKKCVCPCRRVPRKLSACAASRRS